MELISIIIISLIGFFVAVIASMVGGSALLMVPALIFYGIPVQAAIGTNWIADGFMCLTSSIKFYKDKNLKVRKILFFSVVSAASSLIGITILLKIDEKLLPKIISVIIILISVFLLIKNNFGIEKKKSRENIFLVIIISSALGAYGGFFGGGLGSLLMFALIFLYGFNFIEAAANARFVELIISIVIVAIFIFLGKFDKHVVIPYTIASGLGGWLGASVATKIGNIWIKRIFIIISLIAGIKLFLGF